MDSVKLSDQIKPWNGDAEPLFVAAEAAIEAGGSRPWHVSVEITWSGIVWKGERTDPLVLADARTRLRHSAPPDTVCVHLVADDTRYGLNARNTEAGLLLMAEHGEVTLAGRGKEALLANRVYEAARLCLVDLALSEAPRETVPVEEIDSRSIALAIETGSPSPAEWGLLGWIEAHPALVSACGVFLPAVVALIVAFA